MGKFLVRTRLATCLIVQFVLVPTYLICIHRCSFYVVEVVQPYAREVFFWLYAVEIIRLYTMER